MEVRRPSPEDFLEQIVHEENERKHGKLKIFFGYAAGVGKTYTMLGDAHAAKNAGIDVVAGYIEPHTRPETLEMLKGLEMLPNLEIEYKGIKLKDFDLDGAIKRNPQLILVDELAHTNPQGCRHTKRYHDIQELLNSGIDVYTTVNVQHIESLKDVVEAITGIVVRETIPDSIFDSANHVELVDLEPDELIERLNKGKVYKNIQARKALDNFFAKENLIALREVALRRTADKVNKIVEKDKKHVENKGYFTEEHILVCISPSVSNSKVIRNAARLADAFHGTFTALLVETPEISKLVGEEKENLAKNLKLAEQLKAKIAIVYGDDLAEQISEYSNAKGISKIVVGRMNNKRKHFWQANLVEKLIELTPNIDVYIIPDKKQRIKKRRTPVQLNLSIKDILKSLIILSIATLISLWFYDLGYSEANIIMVYISGVLFTALFTKGRFYGSISSVLSVLIFDFLFIDPRFSFTANDAQYSITFLVMFLSAFITSTLTMRVKNQANKSALKAYRTEVLLETNQKLQSAKNRNEIIDQIATQIGKLLNKTILVYVPNGDCLDEPLIYKNTKKFTNMDKYLDADEKAVAEWVYKNNKHAGATTDTLPGAECYYVAIRNNIKAFLIVAIPIEQNSDIDVFDKSLLIAMLGEGCIAFEKEEINQIKNEIEVRARQEELRANLLRAISHDLRTPLTGISGNAAILMDKEIILDDIKKLELYADIYEDSMWLINMVENLLSVTRIENSEVSLTLEAELIEEVLDEVMAFFSRKSIQHNIKINLENDMLMAKMDYSLIIQVIINIVDNAIKYTNPSSEILISVREEVGRAIIEVIDEGEGIPEELEDKIFEMFFTVSKAPSDSRRGLGIGLSLCKSIIDAHNGNIYMKHNIPKGLIVGFTLEKMEVMNNE